MIDERVMEEYERLVDLFKDVEENKTKLVDKAINIAANFASIASFLFMVI